ncbi:MAG: elongation factor P maturation arginine rhamnosyltransferase EarP [Candidatus Accumulibacter sp.]|jgi:uncharacterized repeat protein (TIGR03837 family)|nr:elongation factor P maturation arginine rhamnosyltransferase EarP [Accumulibacter sp.]
MNPSTPNRPASRALLRWDVFCHVVDNFGDAGVCWRLARQLAGEFGRGLRLWVDDLGALRAICPEVDAGRAAQWVGGVELRRWAGDLAGVAPGDAVVETFGCRLPEAFEAAMARRAPKPVWVNLEHLSAEGWVAGFHARPSPHPRLPLTKYFFFPGFSDGTGGLLREADLERRRAAFAADADARRKFLAGLGAGEAPGDGALLVSLFCYESAPLARLLEVWARGSRAVRCLVPSPGGGAPGALERFAGRRLAAGEVLHAGRLEARAVRFLPQPEYDRLLWCCDLNFVRGEDSFVRAQWAGRPMVWNIYPQAGNAHRAKLDAFLDAQCAGWPDAPGAAAREFTLAWNGFGEIGGAGWDRWAAALPAWRRQAEAWRENLAARMDLCSSLVQFCESKL